MHGHIAYMHGSNCFSHELPEKAPHVSLHPHDLQQCMEGKLFLLHLDRQILEPAPSNGSNMI